MKILSNIKYVIKHIKYHIIFIIIFSSVLFININKTHDWGGDFAMYLTQAKNIVEGNPQTDNGYLYNPDNPMNGPKVYPVGFPLLLSPVYALFGLSIKPYIIYNSFFLFLFSFLVYFFFKQKHSSLISGIMVLIILFNPWTLTFKMEIVTEISFSFFFMLSVFLLYKRKFLWAGIFAAYCIMIRSMGYSLVIGAVVYFIYLNINPKKNLQQTINWKYIFMFCLIALTIPYLINNIIFNIPAASSLYKNNFSSDHLFFVFTENLNHYILLTQTFFYKYQRYFGFLSTATAIFFVALAMLGFFIRVFKKLTIYDFVFLVYLGVLLIYPYRKSGFRFLLPVAPFLMLYALEGFKNIRWPFAFNSYNKKMVAMVISLIIVLQYYKPVSSIIQNQSPLKGPQEQTSKEAFQFIQNRLPKNAIVHFSKPRVLSLYTGVKSYVSNKDQTVGGFKNKLDEFGTSHIITHNDLYRKPVHEFISQNPESVELIWDNQKFKIFRLKYPKSQPTP